MTDAFSIRPLTTPPRIVGRDPIVYAQELQEFLERVLAIISRGVEINTGTAVSLTPSSSNAEGTSDELALSDHTHNVSAVAADALAKVYLLG